MFQWIENHVRNTHAAATSENLKCEISRMSARAQMRRPATTPKMLRKNCDRYQKKEKRCKPGT